LRDGPNNEQCQKLLYNFYKGSKYFDELKVPILTVKQRDYMREKCMTHNPGVYRPIYELASVGIMISP